MGCKIRSGKKMAPHGETHFTRICLHIHDSYSYVRNFMPEKTHRGLFTFDIYWRENSNDLKLKSKS